MLAVAAGLRVMALTDHDTTAGLAEASEAAKTVAISGDAGDRFTFIPGIELTTTDAHEQHILGYFIDYEDGVLKDFLARLMDMRRARAENILEYLKKKDVPLSYEQTARLTESHYIGRPQIAAAMVEAGYVGTIKEAFQKYFSGEAYKRIPRPKPSAGEAIAAIKAADGTAVLAHPHSLQLSDTELAERIRNLKAQGLAGLECHYGVYTREQTKTYIALAESMDLVITGGSDFHGPKVKPGVQIATGKDNMLDYNDTGIVSRLV
jgi:predicted metal-dependent phosphoesterase TrpH